MTPQVWSTHAQQLAQERTEIRSGSDIWSFCLAAGLLRGGFAVFLDLDDFRSANTRLGRDGADALLEKFWNRLLQILPPGAFGIRWSGNAFLLIVDVPDPSFRTLLRNMMQPLQVGSQTSHCSAGCARTGSPTTLDACLDLSMRADSALTLAKKRGGNMAVLCNGPGQYDVLFCGMPSRRMYEPFDRTRFIES